MRGLKNHEASERSCREYGELRDLLRPRRRYSQIISATLRRSRFVKGVRMGSTSCGPFQRSTTFSRCVFRDRGLTDPIRSRQAGGPAPAPWSFRSNCHGPTAPRQGKARQVETRTSDLTTTLPKTVTKPSTSCGGRTAKGPFKYGGRIDTLNPDWDDDP
jgi:hypothetical protein